MGKKVNIKSITTTEESKLNIIIRYIFMILLFVVPFYKGLFFEKHFFPAAVIFLILGVAFVVSNWKELNFDKIDFIFLALCLSYGLSMIMAADIRASLLALIKYIVYFACFYIARNAFVSKLDKERIIDTIIASVSVITLFTIFCEIGFIPSDKLIIDGRFSGTFTYANTYAAILAAVCVYLIVQLNCKDRLDINPVRKYLYLFSLFINNFALYATLSRGGVLIYGGALLLVILMTKYKAQMLAYILFTNILAIGSNFLALKLKGSLILLVFILGFITMLLIFKLLEKIGRRILYGTLAVTIIVPVVGLLSNLSKTPFARLADFNFSDVNITSRYLFYVDAIKIFLLNPIIGRGGGAWEYLYKRFQTVPYDTTLAHSSLFQSLVEVGALGTAFFILLVGAAVYRFVLKRKNGETTFVETGIFISLIVILIHSLIDFDFSLPYVLIVFSILVGTLIGKSQFIKMQSGLKVIPMGLLTVALLISFSIFIAGGTFNNVSSSMNNGQISLSDYEKFKAAYETAGMFDPLNSKYKSSLGQLILARAMVDKNTQMVNEGLEYLRKAVELSPNDYFNYVILGTSLYKLDRYDEAVANYQEVIHLFPFVNVGYDDLAQTYIKRCMATKEKSYAEKTSKLYDSAVEKMNTVPEKYLKYVNKQIYTSNSPILTFQAGVAEYLLGNYNKGIERFETALTYATEDSFKKEVQAWIIVGDKRVNMPVPSGINADVNTVTKVEKILDEFKEK